MRHRRSPVWVRLLCAVALGLGLSATAVGVAPVSAPARPAGTHVQRAVADLVAKAPVSVRHTLHRPGVPAVAAGLLIASGLVGGLRLTTIIRRRSTASAGRRTHAVGARAPPVAIGT